jgi:hypothetical protein
MSAAHIKPPPLPTTPKSNCSWILFNLEFPSSWHRLKDPIRRLSPAYCGRPTKLTSIKHLLETIN